MDSMQYNEGSFRAKLQELSALKAAYCHASNESQRTNYQVKISELTKELKEFERNQLKHIERSVRLTEELKALSKEEPGVFWVWVIVLLTMVLTVIFA